MHRSDTTPFLAVLSFLFSLAVAVPAMGVEDSGPTGPIVSPIIGGGPAAPGTRPWMAALVRTTTRTGLSPATLQTCGGVLIDRYYVLTAAHCLRDRTPNSLQIIIGRQDLNGSGGEMLEPAEFILHPRYGTLNSTHDIALIRLKTPSSAPTLALASASDLTKLRNGNLRIHGWGFQSYRNLYECKIATAEEFTPGDFLCGVFVVSSGTNPSQLMEGGTQMHTHQECEKRYRDYRRRNKLILLDKPYYGEDVTPDVLCLWLERDLLSACFGDSGGPVTGTVSGREVVLGVASYIAIAECESSSQISAYTSVPWHLDFIAEVLDRAPGLSFAELCPGPLTPNLTYAAQADGSVRARISWNPDPLATGYQLFYSPWTGAAPVMRKLELDGAQSTFAVTLQRGQEYRVAVQARGSACDGPMSASLAVGEP